MRTVSNLLTLNGWVYVYLASANLSALFFKNAENEGFTFGGGRRQTESHTADIIALNTDWTINYVSWAGHMAFRYPQEVVGETLVRVDYGKYLAGCEEFAF